MAHLRVRHAIDIIQKQAKLWPVVGLLGPRQSGKTTQIQSLLGLDHLVSFDDLKARTEVNASPDTFLAKMSLPLALDEAQKAPEIFDAIKLKVDRKRIPGSYYLTGSSAFSAKLGIRESLTGRIGLVELFPMTLAELHQLPFRNFKMFSQFISDKKPRFDSTQVMQTAVLGGMPVPAFLRDGEQRDFYWKSWLETILYRDLSRFFQQGYDPDFAYSILYRMAEIFKEGELPTLKHFKQSARKLRLYLNAMTDIFLLRKIQCHPEGIGKEVWILMDSGLCQHLMGTSLGEGATLSLIRHVLWNEWGSLRSYQGQRFERVYYKSAQGSPVDAILDGVPFRIISHYSASQWDERPLLGAMKKLNSKVGYLVAPVDQVIPSPKKNGIGIIPWGTWS